MRDTAGALVVESVEPLTSCVRGSVRDTARALVVEVTGLCQERMSGIWALTEMSSSSILDLGFLLMDMMRKTAPSILIGFRKSCGRRGTAGGGCVRDQLHFPRPIATSMLLLDFSIYSCLSVQPCVLSSFHPRLSTHLSVLLFSPPMSHESIPLFIYHPPIHLLINSPSLPSIYLYNR